MSGKVLILRPRPGADETAARARAMGLDPVVAPLFAIRTLNWQPPDPADYDGVVLTSANAARCAGPGIAAFFHLPCFAVGEATGEAARRRRFTDVRTGPSDAAALIARIGGDIRRLLHPCGREHIELCRSGLTIDSVPVYATDPEPVELTPLLAANPLALLHSPRAAARFAELATDKDNISIAAISAATAAAAGHGWRSVAVAARPRDQAFLELAAKLCNTDAERGGGCGP